jgi:hypothetical protein
VDDQRRVWTYPGTKDAPLRHFVCGVQDAPLVRHAEDQLDRESDEVASHVVGDEFRSWLE